MEPPTEFVIGESKFVRYFLAKRMFGFIEPAEVKIAVGRTFFAHPLFIICKEGGFGVTIPKELGFAACPSFLQKFPFDKAALVGDDFRVRK